MTIKFDGVPTSELVSTFNECAALLGVVAVKKFADRATAEKRVRFILSQLRPEKRPGRYREDPGPMKGSVRAKDAPHPAIKSVTSTSPKSKPVIQPKDAKDPNLSMARKVMGKETKDKTPTPPVKAPAERWRRPKELKPAKVAYRPRAGSKQAIMYDLLTSSAGITPEAFAHHMNRQGGSTLWAGPNVWGSLSFLFATQKGYGLSFDGRVLRLVVPSVERPAPTSKKEA